MKVDILAIGAHPDDVELGCGATLAKEISLGKKIGILDLTQGELGTRGNAEIRLQEAKKAASILKVTSRENMGFSDAFFTNDKKHQLKIVSKIRKYQPDIILCNAPDDRHFDHPKAAQLVVESCFLSGLVKIETTLDGEKQAPWRPKNIFHYLQWKSLTPDFVVDVSEFMELKLKSVKAYESQFYDPKSKEPTSPISSKNFIESVVYRAKDLGRLTGVTYAEGFISNKIPTVTTLNNFI